MGHKFLALGLCALYLVGIHWLWMVTACGRFTAYALGVSPRLADVVPDLPPEGPESGLLYAIYVIGALALFGVWLLDVWALFVADEAEGTEVPKPSEAPMEYAAFRLRRYVPIPFMLFWVSLLAGCVSEGIAANPGLVQWISLRVMGMFAFLVMYSRRGLRESSHDMLAVVVNAMTREWFGFELFKAPPSLKGRK